ncbi:MAG: hypothetical protein HFH19_10070, partial [Ruminococcus sp.]|nr:hypothetical protein [Ruminococcus sp.]
MFKKMVSVMLAGAMVISLAACGGGGSDADSGSGSQSETSGESSSDEGSDEGGSHQAQLPNGFAGRGIDQQYITPFMKSVSFPAMA